MRLIKLKVKNIASLKGEHLIEFAEIQRQSPLFAITGETGAGKSSILNSIGLALYGKVYKSNVTQNDLVTLGEKEGQIELIFQIKGKNYLAFWKARVRKQNGEPYSTPQTPQRELYTLEGENFDSPKIILTTRTEELLNLDFDQYCKCIILNQGEFARFLSSSFTERKEILEKLYPGEMLESLSRELKAELDGLQKQKNDLDIELAALKGDGPQGDDLANVKDQLEANFKVHEKWFNHLEKIASHYSSLHTYHTKNQETKNRIDNLKQTLTQETAVFNQLLIKVRESSEILTTLQEDQQKKLPHLQELLKQEEQLKNQSELKAQTQQSLEQLSTQLEQIKLKYDQTNLRLKEWQQKSSSLKTSFLYPLDELRNHQESFDGLFDLANRKGLIDTEIKGKEERLMQLEEQGKAEAQELKTLGAKKTSVEEDKKRLTELEARRKEAQLIQENKSRAILKEEELKRQLNQLHQELEDFQKQEIVLNTDLANTRDDYLPVETTIKLQSLLSAVEVCLTHPSLEETHACPVCQTSLDLEKLKGLRQDVQKTDFAKIKARETELSRLILKQEAELAQVLIKLKNINAEVLVKSQELLALTPSLQATLPDIKKLDEELNLAQKSIWEQEQILKDEERISAILKKTREQYLAHKNDLQQKQTLKQTIDVSLNKTLSTIGFLKDGSAETLGQLKLEVKKLLQWLELESQGEKLTQEQNFLTQQQQELQSTWGKLQEQVSALSTKVLQLTTNLEKELGNKKASDIIMELQQKLKLATDELSGREKELKAQELKMKGSQSQLYTLDELVKDIDLQFTNESHKVKELAQVTEQGTTELNNLMEKLSQLGLKLDSSADLFVPLKDLIESQKSYYKEKTSELKMAFAEVRARLEDWEKRQDRIALLQLKAKDLITLLDRRARLYEVLGKDELRTFVLSLVEENLINQTNEELQKLCQGRYEIVHQSRRMKITPEFYILDKFREGGLRKVSTLSGGETFMVSLAMALGLAEMTRGKAEIDSLFIDEGFGTLDQESLEDVLDMLKQIQNRGLMVGLISHVKALTSALPVNLQVTKKQDGTSSVAIIHN
jgi:DNA repair protein SbcC/Rad50